MRNPQLIAIALRVLNARMARTTPAPDDVEELLREFGGAGRGLPSDVVATRILAREVEKVRARRAGSGEGALRKSNGA